MSSSFLNFWQWLQRATRSTSATSNTSIGDGQTLDSHADPENDRNILEAHHHEDLCGKTIGAYRLRRLLGNGGMGEVYLAEHRLLKRPCAVKLIRSDRRSSHLVARFENEIQATAKLTHPSTVEVYDSGITDAGEPYFVMEFLPGLNLKDIVDRTGPMPADRVIHLLRQVCSALGEAHRHGMVHRDVKPANIFAAERGGIYDVAKLLDFGLVKFTGAESSDVQVTRDGVVAGSPLYAAPEMTLGGDDVDARTDIYSLGATAYFLLTGRPVFDGEKALDVVLAHLREAPAPPSDLGGNIPADLEAVVLKCLAKSPDDRFQTAAELEAALEACAENDVWTTEQAEQWWTETVDYSSRESNEESAEIEETSVVPFLEAA
jgi:eukaryotic-like serine/threonine-protein kinase